MDKTNRFVEKFTTLLLASDPDITNIEVIITRNIVSQRRDVISKERPTAIPAPQPAHKAPEPQAAPPEQKESPVREFLSHPIQNGPRLSRFDAGRAKYKLQLGARPSSLANYYKTSVSLMSGIKSGRLWSSAELIDDDQYRASLHKLPRIPTSPAV